MPSRLKPTTIFASISPLGYSLSADWCVEINNPAHINDKKLYTKVWFFLETFLVSDDWSFRLQSCGFGACYSCKIATWRSSPCTTVAVVLHPPCRLFLNVHAVAVQKVQYDTVAGRLRRFHWLCPSLAHTCCALAPYFNTIRHVTFGPVPT